jgi:hypothetical protein
MMNEATYRFDAPLTAATISAATHATPTGPLRADASRRHVFIRSAIAGRRT